MFNIDLIFKLFNFPMCRLFLILILFLYSLGGFSNIANENISKQFNGSYVKEKNIWNLYDYCLKPILWKKIQKEEYIALSGSKCNSSNHCHTCTGAVNFYYFKNNKKIADKLFHLGMYGEPPVDISLIKLAKNFYAWKVELDYSSQGETHKIAVFYAPVGHKIRKILMVPLYYDNAGLHEKTSPSYLKTISKLNFSPVNNNHPVDIEVKQARIFHQKKYTSSVHYHYHAQRMKYIKNKP